MAVDWVSITGKGRKVRVLLQSCIYIKVNKYVYAPHILLVGKV